MEMLRSRRPAFIGRLHEQASLESLDHRLRAVAGAQVVEQRRYVQLDGALGDAQRIGDALVRLAPGNE